MRRYFIFLALGVSLAAAETDTVTLPEAVRIALERHPDVAKARTAAEMRPPARIPITPPMPESVTASRRNCSAQPI